MGKYPKKSRDRFVYLLLAGMVGLSLLMVGITSSGGGASQGAGEEGITPLPHDGNADISGMDEIPVHDEGNYIRAPAPATGEGGAASYSSRTGGGSSTAPDPTAAPGPARPNDVPVTVRLIDSAGTGIAGAVVESDQAGWIAFGVTDRNGTAPGTLAPGTYRFRVVHEGCVCTTSQNITENPYVLFRTERATVLLKTAAGAGLAGGAVEFFAGNWTGFGTTGNNGSTSREMLPGTYPVRVHFQGGVREMVLTTATPLECTTTTVTLHFPGTIRFNSSGWQAFTRPSTELLPGTYPCTFDGYETNIRVNGSAVEKSIFIMLLESRGGSGLSGGTGQYYLSGDWQAIPGGTNASGVLVCAPDGSPGRLNVRMAYANATLRKNQDIRTDPVFRFATTTVTVRSADSVGRGIGSNFVLYAADGWQTFGTTGSDGNATRELLPKTYTFRLISNGTVRNQVQDTSINPLVIFTTNTTTVRLADSTGTGIAGGVIEYYAGGWRTFGTTGADGNATCELLPKSYTFRITSGGATVSKVQDTAADPVVEFWTNLTTVRFETPDGTGIPGAAVEYYADGWNTFGTTGADGNVTRELLPRGYPFRLTYDGTQARVSQDIGADPLVVFGAATATVRFTDSLGNGIAGAPVEYNAGGWKNIGITGADGHVTAVLLPKSYTFRISYGGGMLSKVQDITVDPVVEYQTVLTTVRFKTPDGTGIPGAAADYYAGGWKNVGTTGADGNVTQELLPMSYRFRISYEGMTETASRDIAVDPCVVFETNAATVRFTDSTGTGIAGGFVEYNAGGWKTFGTTGADGNVTAALLPKSYTFRITADGATVSTTQDIAVDPVVEFTTARAIVSFADSTGTGIPGTAVEYYAGGWKTFGTTAADGNTAHELLPKSYRFRLTYDGMTETATRDIAVDPCVVFETNAATVRFTDSTGTGIAGGFVEYSAGGWKPFGTTGADGSATKELLPKSYTFRITSGGATVSTTQDIAVDPAVEFTTARAIVSFADSTGTGIPGTAVEYYAAGWKLFGTTGTDGSAMKELLPKSYRFRISHDGVRQEREQDIGIDPLVPFSTSLATVRFLAADGSGISGGVAEYYAGGWKTFGTTGADGDTTRELLPVGYTFRLTYGSRPPEEQVQDIGADPVVVFRAQPVAVRLIDSGGAGLSGGIVRYRDSGWKSFGTTGADGYVTADLPPQEYEIEIAYNGHTLKDILTDPSVPLIFQTGAVHSVSGNCTDYKANGWEPFTQDMELLPGEIQFRFDDGTRVTKYTVAAGGVTQVH